jgi:hypothetical protein
MSFELPGDPVVKLSAGMGLAGAASRAAYAVAVRAGLCTLAAGVARLGRCGPPALRAAGAAGLVVPRRWAAR